MSESFRDIMERGWSGGKPETRCGKASLKASAQPLLADLAFLVERYGIRSVCDAGAGDLNWIGDVPWSVEYRAFDLVPRHADVTEWDICKATLPACDLVLCRAVLNHMDAESVKEALARFRVAGKYLLATNFPAEPQAVQPNIALWTPWNLAIEPFGLGAPLERIIDPSYKGELALWKQEP